LRKVKNIEHSRKYILWKLQISIRYRISIYSRIFNRDLSYSIIDLNCFAQ